MTLPLDVLAEEVPHQLGDLVAVLLEGEVPGVEQVKLQVLQVALVGLGAGGREDLVVLSPDDQRRRLVLAEVCLPLRIERRIAAVAVEQGELDLVVARPVEQRLVDVPGVGADRLQVPTPSVYCHMVASQVSRRGGRLASPLSWLLPVSLDRLPEVVVEPLVVGVAVLHDEGRDAVRVLDGQAVADRRAVVLNIQGVLRQADLLGELRRSPSPGCRRCTSNLSTVGIELFP